MAHAMALENERVSADVVGIAEFPSVAQAYAIRSVPITVINEYTRFPGVVSEAQLLDKVLEAGVAAPQEAGGGRG